MKNFNQIFCYCLLSIATITNSCFGQEKSSASDSRKLAMTWIETLNKHDTDALALFYDEHVQLESPNWEGIQTGRAMARQTYSRYFSSTPDLKFELSNMVVADNAVVIEYRSFGTLSNPEKSTPDYMRGKKYSLLNCTRMNIEKGKITKQATYFDQVAFLRQMGFFDR